MKTNLAGSSWLLILLLITFGCSKSDDNQDGSNNNNSGFPTQGIIYSSDGMWVINADGTDNRQFATETGLTYALSSTRDGSKFIFHRWLTGLVVLNKDGETVIIDDSLIPQDGMVTWSKGGKIFLSMYKNSPGGGRYIYSMNADGTALTQVTPDFIDPDMFNEPRDDDPSVAPDNSSILFTTQRSGNMGVLAKMDLSDSQITYLTYPGGLNSTGTMGVYAAAYPSFSPDGSKIVFTGAIDNTLPDAEQNHQQVFVMNADGSGKTSLTHMTVANCSYPSWSPDGSMIVFQQDSMFVSSICVMNADGSNLRVLGNGTYPCFVGQPR